MKESPVGFSLFVLGLFTIAGIMFVFAFQICHADQRSSVDGKENKSEHFSRPD
jgi:hypothetical protein